jgi:acyl-CoA dehydrogenase
MHEEAQLVMELGWTTPAFRSLFGTNNGIAGHTLLEGGTDAQRETYLPKLASGEWIASFGLTEPEAGSDPGSLTTRAVRDGDDWVINGVKRYITNAPVADVIMVFARTSPSGPPSRSISVFLVPTLTPGVTIGPKDRKMGQAGAWCADVMLDDVRVPHDTMIGGAEGAGYVTAMRSLAHGRLHIAALCVGMAERLVHESLTYAMARQQGGRPIAEFQLVQAMLADSKVDTMAARALVLDAARRFDDGVDVKLGPAASKYFASEAVGRVADRAVQIHGGAGYMRGIAVERLYRDARLFRIYEGTSQIQQLVIAAQMMRSA